jgi:hypothetical protein
MTEEEWLDPGSPEALLNALVPTAPDRQQRLWGCAVVRQLCWDHLLDEVSRRAIEVAERYAEGQARMEELETAREAAARVYAGVSLVETVVDPGWAASRAVEQVARAETAYNLRTALLLGRITHAPFLADPVGTTNWAHRGDPDRRAAAEALEIRTAYEIFSPNPFRVVGVSAEVRAWRGGLVVAMAESILTTRAWDQLPILADALEDAGCVDGLLLEHLRDPGPHFVGCWAVDRILGRARWKPRKRGV